MTNRERVQGLLKELVAEGTPVSDVALTFATQAASAMVANFGRNTAVVWLLQIADIIAEQVPDIANARELH